MFLWCIDRKNGKYVRGGVSVSLWVPPGQVVILGVRPGVPVVLSLAVAELKVLSPPGLDGAVLSFGVPFLVWLLPPRP